MRSTIEYYKWFLFNQPSFIRATAGFSIFATITLYLKVVPLPFRGVVGTLDIMLLNVMAGRVFRNMKLGVYWEGPETIASRVVNEIDITTVPVADVGLNCGEHTSQIAALPKYQPGLV